MVSHNSEHSSATVPAAGAPFGQAASEPQPSPAELAQGNSPNAPTPGTGGKPAPTAK